MILALYLLVIAVVFGLIALCDFGLKKILPKPKHAQKGNAVRMPRYSFIFGLVLTLAAVMVLLSFSVKTQKLLWCSAWGVLVMGAFLLTNFIRFAIFYDEEGFTYRTLTKKAKSYRYADITAQQSFLAKSGWNSTLYVGGDEISLTAAMQGVDKFLNKAFFAWCKAKNIDPDTVENNPTMLVFFPEPEDQAEC